MVMACHPFTKSIDTHFNMAGMIESPVLALPNIGVAKNARITKIADLVAQLKWEG
jgi:hypothetical protein